MELLLRLLSTRPGGARSGTASILIPSSSNCRLCLQTSSRNFRRSLHPYTILQPKRSETDPVQPCPSGHQNDHPPSSAGGGGPPLPSNASTWRTEEGSRPPGTDLRGTIGQGGTRGIRAGRGGMRWSRGEETVEGREKVGGRGRGMWGTDSESGRRSGTWIVSDMRKG